MKLLLGEKPLVLDREFSYEDMLESLVSEGLKFVIRLNLGSNPPRLFNDEGHQVGLVLEPLRQELPGTVLHGQSMCEHR